MSVFSEIHSEEYVFESEHFFAIHDRYPVSPGHLLIISKSEKENFFNLNDDERNELNSMIIKAKNTIDAVHSPGGYNIGMNCG